MRNTANQFGVVLAMLQLWGCADMSARSLSPSRFYVAREKNDAIPLSSPLPYHEVEASPPAGFLGFCVRMPAECRVPAAASDHVTLTLTEWMYLRSINKEVNESIWPEDDRLHYGRAEYWTIPSDGYGDCEDYALAKRDRLVAVGLSPAALRIALVVTPSLSRHAVLTVATNDGDYVLDNLSEDVLPWDRTGYSWLERQAQNGFQWNRFDKKN